jgi:putative ABC transport system substrate-binding protein
LSLSRKCLLVLYLVLGLVAALAGGVASAKVAKIGITQIVEHPSLDAARQGFIDRLKELGYEQGKQVTYDLRNAQGDMATAQTIAQKFVADRVDIILAIATPTAQAAANATSKIPILITAVTDPQAAGLVRSNDKPATNVTGTSDLNPVAEQLGLVKQLDTKARRVGVLYNAGETNSLVQVGLARKAAPGLGLTLVEATVSSSNEVLQAAQSLLNRVDAIYVPTDNTVVSALESVIMVAEQGKLPLVVGEGDSVRRGGLITVGIDYYRLGRQTGDMAVAVLKGSDPANMPIQYQKELLLTVNLKAAKAMGVQVPQALLSKADDIIR